MLQQHEIIMMARQVGYTPFEALKWERALTNFAKLVAAKEREACANVCEQQEEYGPLCETIWDCAEAIRARGEAA